MLNFIKSLFFRPRDENESLADGPEPLVVNEIVESLDVHSRGASDGRNGTPASDAESMTLAEVEITGHFQNKAQTAAVFFRNKILDLQKIVKQKSLTKFDNQLKAVVPNLKADVDALVTTSRTQLIDAKRRENELRDEYDRFRRAHNLRRLAHYPESRVFLIAVILAILLLEAVLNGYFFAKANEFGLVGGVGQALITASINVIVGWSFGRFLFTQINHCSASRRFSAVVIVPAMFVAFVVFYNMFIGHFRDALAATVDTATLAYTDVGRDVLQSVLEDPVGLQSFDSWLLVMLGIVFALVAALDGYFFNDPYPGYGRVAKRYEDARRDYMSDKTDLLTQLSDLRDRQKDAVDSVKLQIESQNSLIQNALTWSQKTEKEAKSYLADLTSICNHVLQIYRTSNQEARSDAIPVYFQKKFDPLEDIIDSTIESIDTSSIQEQVANVENMLKTATKAKRDVQRIYTQATEKIAMEIESIEKS